MTLQGKNLIAGKWLGSAGKSYHAIDPATGASLETSFTEATESDVDVALKSADEAFASYRRVPDEIRAQFLEAIASEIEAQGDELLNRCNAETALPIARLQGERARTCGQLRLFASVVRDGSWVDARIDRALPDRQPLPRPDLRRMLIGVGPVVVLGSSNFPLAFSVAGGDTASAFAAGCPVVVKAHPAHPGTSERVAHAIATAAAACKLPGGIFSLLHGGPEIATALVKHPLTAAVGFTGSHRAGRALFDAAASRPHPIPVFSEMSSLNPTFLLPGALQERGAAIAQGLAGSVSLGVGQFCTKPGLAFALRSASTDTFIEALGAHVRSASAGTMLTPGIREAFTHKRDEILRQPNVVQLTGPRVQPETGNTAALTVAVTSVRDFLASNRLTEEAFGPFTMVVVADDAAELIACARALEGQLTATVHGNASDLENVGALIDVLTQKAGRVLVNGYPTGVEVSPAMQHGGPYPATSDSRFTSVGTAAIFRFARPVCYQNFPHDLLPAALRNENPRGIMRMIDGQPSRAPLA